MYSVNKVFTIVSFFILFTFSKIVNGQVCKLMVEKCDDERDVCSAGCESMCSRNFGVCVTTSGLAYCHCFNREAKKNWHKEHRNKLNQLRQEIIKEDQEELEKLLILTEDDSEENDSENDNSEAKEVKDKGGKKRDKNGKDEEEHSKDEKVKKSKSKRNKDEDEL